MTNREVAKLLTEKLYQAATKAGMVAELNRLQIEVYVQEWNGKKTAHVEWEHELAADDDNFVWPTNAFLDRVKVFVAKLAPKYGYEVPGILF